MAYFDIIARVYVSVLGPFYICLGPIWYNIHF